MAEPASTRSSAAPAPHRAPDPRSPHPSWRQAAGGGDRDTGRIVSAGDFWARLGL